MERVLCLFAGLQHYYSHFVNEVYFLHQHSGHPRADQSHVLEVHVKSHCLHAEMTAQDLKVVQMLDNVVVNYIATVR